MFFHVDLAKNLTVHPAHLGPNLKEKLAEKLVKSINGTLLGQYGYVVCVTNINEIGKGKVQEGSGNVIFPISYSAVVFRPFKGEIVDGVVGSVNKMGMFVEVGPLTIFVSERQMPDDLKYDDMCTPPAWVSSLGDRITEDSNLRVKIVGIRIDSAISLIGSIKDDYLGLTPDD